MCPKIKCFVFVLVFSSELNVISSVCYENVLQNTSAILTFLNGSTKAVTAQGCFDESLDENSADIKWILVQNASLPKLKYLSVNNLPNLEFLAIVNSKLHHIGDDAFQNLPKLEVLKIWGNNLESISDVFGNINVTNLAFTNSNLKTIQAGTFSRLENLKLLFLNSNLLTTLSTSWFVDPETSKLAKLEKLEYFDITYNRLHTIEPDVFEAMPNVNHLQLGNNKLKVLSPNIKIGNRNIVYLNDNNFMYLEPEVLDAFKDVKDVYLYYNPWKCPCFFEIFKWGTRNPQTKLHFKNPYNYQKLIFGPLVTEEVKRTANNNNDPECVQGDHPSQSCIYKFDEEAFNFYYKNIYKH